MSLPPFAPENLGPAIGVALQSVFRPAAESMMVDACLVERSTGRTPDPVTLELVETWEAVYGPDIVPERGKCRFKPTDAQSNDLTEGEREFLVGRAELQLPISAPLLGEGLRVTVTGSPLDPAQVGRVLWTDGSEPRTHATKRTVALSEVRHDAD